MAALEAAIQQRMDVARDRTENRFPLFLTTRLRFSDNPMRKTKR
jgi:hypothetical protein